jgi:hypothetical protein
MTQLLDYVTAHPWLLWLVAGVLSLVLSRRSQIDAYAEMHPRVAGIMKLLRSLGLDPWMLLQSLSLIVRGRLPEPPPVKSTRKLPPLVVIGLLCFVLALAQACANWKPAARTANDLAADFCALSVAELQGISVEQALETACNTHEKLKPWLDELLAAQRAAGAKAGLSK